MNRRFDGLLRHWVASAAVVAMTVLPIQAQDADTARKDWRSFADVVFPKDPAAGTKFGVVNLPGPVLARSQPGRPDPDLADLRLTDAKGESVPYVLRVERAKFDQVPIGVVRRFDAGPSEKNKVFEESLEIAPVDLPGYNDIEIETPGSDFRRRVQVFGSNAPDFAGAQSLLPKNSWLVRFEAGGRPVVVNRFRFGYVRFRFLKIRVNADPYAADDAPTIGDVTVRRTEKAPGEYVTRPVSIARTESIRMDGGAPGTAYFFDIGVSDEGRGKVPAIEPMFCEKLSFQVGRDTTVDRPFRLQIADRNKVRSDIGAEWQWRLDGDRQFVDLIFPEVRVQTLRLAIADFDNRPMQISDPQATSAVRRLVFEWPDFAKTPLPWKLYFGNDSALPPNYDLAKRLPPKLEPPPASVSLGPVQPNPGYIPPEPEFSDKHPWVIYCVLGAACALLAGLLVPLARQTVKAAEPPPRSPENEPTERR